MDDFMILDRTAQKIEELRRNLHDQVTANRGGREKWQNIQTEQVEIEVCGLDAVYYSQRSAVDIDRLAQAAIAQGDFIRKTRGGLPVTQGDETLYRSFDHFSMDATLCLFGRDGYKKPMSKSEELAIGWAVFNHANWPKEFIVFGRNEDRLHSGIVSKYGITSEYFQGGILNPEKWNPFINDCWALGGIKAGNAFMPVTDFMSLSRKVLAAPNPPRISDDIRNDDTELDHAGQPFHFIVTMRSTELKALKDCGYQLTSHPAFGQLYLPCLDLEFVEKRAKYTLVDMRISAETMRVTQAIQNLTGEVTLSESLMGFVKPSTYSNIDQDMFRDHISRLQLKGLPFTSLANRFLRKTDFVIAKALEQLAKCDLPGAQKRSMLQAISSAIRYTAKPYFIQLGIDKSCRQLLLLEIDKRVAEDVGDQKFDSKFTLSTFRRVEIFIDDHVNSVREDPCLTAAQKYLVSVQTEFNAGIFDHKVGGVELRRDRFEPTDLKLTWKALKREVGYQLAVTTSTNLSIELGYKFVVEFLENFRPIPHVTIR
ncbi:hypothetical protein C8J57DRAFT_154650 [Mycena rebaudengoi]|nr:hypothetical protein C8J57DRAFT_154650 [Mycena rebaudengoi]